MSNVELTRHDDVAVLTLHRGKVNAINMDVVVELGTLLDRLKTDASTRAIVLTGNGKFFSFGLDVPELFPLSRERFTEFLSAFTDLYTTLFVYAKPVIAAINGHAIAGGCMLAIACDRRCMEDGKGKIALNEITFGSSVFAGCTEMLRACIGQGNAEQVLLRGDMYGPRAALAIGLVDRVLDPEQLLLQAIDEARGMGSRDGAVFASLKTLLRGPIHEAMRRQEGKSIHEFVEIWYSESTREQLKRIEIRG